MLVNTTADPLPLSVVPVGKRVTIQVPEAGSPLRATLPVAVVHVGCVIAPVTGADGDDGWAGITTSADKDVDVQPAAFVTE